MYVGCFSLKFGSLRWPNAHPSCPDECMSRVSLVSCGLESVRELNK